VIKEYFLDHNDALTNDFILERDGGETRIELLSNDTGDWRATFVDTGVNSTIGERLKAVESYIGTDEAFLATYGDDLTDAPLDAVVESFVASGKIAHILSVRPQFHAHLVTTGADGTVLAVTDMSKSHIRINGGFFVFRREIFDFIEPGDELVEETFARLIQRGEVVAHEYDGFFGPMDTIKDRQRLEAMDESGRAPWRLVGREAAAAPDSPR
jgi:glucose-1-phosphate cytidylyltransferase